MQIYRISSDATEQGELKFLWIGSGKTIEINRGCYNSKTKTKTNL